MLVKEMSLHKETEVCVTSDASSTVKCTVALESWQLRRQGSRKTGWLLAAIWGVSQWLKDLSFRLFLCATLTFK